jgi:hypothetical protein
VGEGDRAEASRAMYEFLRGHLVEPAAL